MHERGTHASEKQPFAQVAYHGSNFSDDLHDVVCYCLLKYNFAMYTYNNGQITKLLTTPLLRIASILSVPQIQCHT